MTSGRRPPTIALISSQFSSHPVSTHQFSSHPVFGYPFSTHHVFERTS